MSQIENNDHAIVRSLVLMSAMSTATDVVVGMAERRRGIDPSAQEESSVTRPYLREAAAELDEHLIALQAGRALQADTTTARTVQLARSVNEVLLLNRLVRVFHGIHQRLLSLYPSVPEALVEQARILEDAFVRDRDCMGRHSTPGLIAEAEIFNVALRGLVETD